jgi:cobalt-zinc-cadmium resistance protein CzcA
MMTVPIHGQLHFEVSVGIKPYSEWPSEKQKQTYQRLAADYKEMPGFTVGFHNR